MKSLRLFLLSLTALAFVGPAFSMHHQPVEKPKPSDRPAAVSVSPDAKSDAGVVKFLRTLAQALHDRKPAPVVALLAPEFTIEGLPPQARQTLAEVFAQAVERVPAPEEIVITSVRTANGVTTAKAELAYASRVAVRTFRFDAQGRLLGSDFFRINAQPHGAAAPTPTPAPAPAATVAPTTTVISFGPGVQPNDHFAEILGYYADALATGDLAAISPPADDLAVTGLDGVRGAEAFRQAGSRLGGRLHEITLTGMGQSGNLHSLRLTLRRGDHTWPAELRFNSEMRLQGAELLPPTR